MSPLRHIALPLTLPLLLAGCFERTQATVADDARPVQVVTVALANDTDMRAYTGMVVARREADIGFRAGGRIAERLVDVGTRFTAGQVLARLDPVDLDLAVRSAEADLASAEAQATQATSDATRSAKLRADGWASAADDELKQAAARAAVEHVKSARAALDMARDRRDYAELRAARDGVVTAVIRDRGTVVAEGDAVLHVAETTAPEAEIRLPEQALPDAGRAGATVTLWARPDLPIRATLREIAPVADGKLRTYTARYVLHDAPAWVGLGMTATLHLAEGGAARVATLPAAALVDRGSGPMVWQVSSDGALSAQPVQLRRLEQDRVVVAGLADGEYVVAVGGQKLDPAERVRIADARPATE